LHKLSEAADLVYMVEDLIGPNVAGQLSAAGWAGVRITLRNIRENILNSHASLSSDLVSRARSSVAATASTQAAPSPEQRSTATPAKTETATSTTARQENGSHLPTMSSGAENGPRIQMTRKDLKASLERFIER